MASILQIKRKRGDTRRITFVIKDADGVVVPIGGWTAFLLTVDPDKAPVDNTNNIFQVSGSLVTDGTDGRVYFTPAGTSVAAEYYYDAQATDDNGEKITFAEGSYKLTQDITKD